VVLNWQWWRTLRCRRSRFIGVAAGLGRIGRNAFLFHPEWGPWVHLRVIATSAELDLHPKLSGDQFCDQCGLCILECPAQAISDSFFEGLQCRSYRKAKGNMNHMILMVSCLTANDVFGFARKGSNQFHAQALKGLLNKALNRTPNDAG